ncbi:Exostoses (Multiple)-like 3 [Dinochytrium kinnereticum]|nr:Exostoses (Multiple)-like 3 [Dinochytrium kinnereticum]
MPAKKQAASSSSGKAESFLDRVTPKRVRKRRLLTIIALAIVFLLMPSRSRGRDTNQQDLEVTGDTSPSFDDDISPGQIDNEDPPSKHKPAELLKEDDDEAPPHLAVDRIDEKRDAFGRVRKLDSPDIPPVLAGSDEMLGDGRDVVDERVVVQHAALIDVKVAAAGDDAPRPLAKIKRKRKTPKKIEDAPIPIADGGLDALKIDAEAVEEEVEGPHELEALVKVECKRDAFGDCIPGENLVVSPQAQEAEEQAELEEEYPPPDTEASQKTEIPWRFVCIIGNSQFAEDALRSHQMWGGSFPSFWFLWGKEDKNKTDEEKIFDAKDDSLATTFHLYRSKQKKTWAQGISYLLPIARKTFDCEYIFTHDDDLEFSPRDPRVDRRPIQEILATMLVTHQPAIAGFPWTVGDKTNEGTRRIERAFNSTDAAPLAYFDSGMVLYHHSVVDLFIPYSPRGEGGFFGDWSLCAHFLNIFGPLTFKGAAVRFNALSYQNLISLDNIPVDQRAPVAVTDEGLAVHEESRHPYEYTFNRKYKTFLSSGMHKLWGRWGRELEPFDVHWPVETPAAPAISITDLTHPSGTDRPDGLRSFDREMVVDSISSFYDLSHDALSTNTYLRSKFSESELRTRVMGKTIGSFRFEIHVFTVDRKESFSRLWTSINSANSIVRDVKIVIHLDRSNKTIHSRIAAREFKEYIYYLKSLSSPHGTVELVQNTHLHGLRQSILDAWNPNDRRSYAIFLEDDVEVSPHFLEYADQVVTRYLFPASSRDSDGADRCMGVSLYNVRYEEVNNRKWRPETGPEFEPYLLQHPQSWGAVWVPEAWAQFITWYISLKEDFSPLIPMSLTNRWLDGKSWKKYLLRFMVENGKYMIYPNFPGDLSLSTNHVEIGTNDRTPGANQEELREKFRVPLLRLKDLYSRQPVEGLTDREAFYMKSISWIDGERVRLNLTAGTSMTALNTFEKAVIMPELQGQGTRIKLMDQLISPSKSLPNLKSLDVYDATFSPEKNISTLLTNARPEAFDKCTMVMPVYSRHATILDRLEYYHTHPLLDSIIIVWNNPSVQPPIIAPHIKSRRRAAQFKKKKKGKMNVFFVPIHIKVQPFNSMNNRYLPFSEMTSDCVISMDDDWDMPHDHITYAIQLWQAQFFNHIVGFRHLGRQHFRGRDGKWYYRKVENDGVSIMLPSGAVYHRRFHEMYSRSLPTAARLTVDKLTNCDDILFNMMVANATNSGPVVIDLFAKPMEMGGLWKEPDHFKKRSECLQDFAGDVFGGMPLKYTTSLFKGRKANGALPSLKDLVVVNEMGSGNKREIEKAHKKEEKEQKKEEEKKEENKEEEKKGGEKKDDEGKS